jgi:hypothetical protein
MDGRRGQADLSRQFGVREPGVGAQQFHEAPVDVVHRRTLTASRGSTPNYTTSVISPFVGHLARPVL